MLDIYRFAGFLSINTNEKAQVVAIRYPEWLGRNLCYYRRNQMEIGFSKFRLVTLTPASIMHQISNLQQVLFFVVKVVLGSDLWRWLNEDLESWVSESKSPAVKQIETTVGCKVQKLGTAKGARSHQNSFVLWFLLFVEQSGRDWTFTSWEGIESNQ